MTIKSISSGSASISYSYDSNYRINKISENGNNYYFSYDCWGNITKIEYGNDTNKVTLAMYDYGANNDELKVMEYNN